ncbi:MAG: HAD-IIIA family hydrolase [Flavobacteriaceae bacterium TMED238]|nr:MAG: HAD-IIIA family hydrolase [Flavobacteriaceae bacterium TMED238]
MKKEIVIIAGGKGSRIKKTLESTPKLLAPIRRGKLLIDYQLEHIKKFNNNNIHFCLGNGSEQILEHLFKKKIKFSYSVEEKPLGTYGALYNSKEHLADSFFILYGDIVTNFNIDFGFKKFKEYDTDFLLISRYTDHPEDSDLISFDHNNDIKKIFRSSEVEYPYPPIACTALMFGKKSSLNIFDKNSKPDIVKDFINKNLGSISVKHHISDSYTKDLGTDNRYKVEIKTLDANLIKRQKIAFLDRDGTLIENNEKNSISNFKINNGAVDLIRALQENQYTVVMITNQPSIAKGFCTEKDVNNLHDHLQHQLIRENIKPLHNIKYCPHHNEVGHKGEIKELKVACDCRKPLSGLIFQTLEELDYKLEETEILIIGDTLNDYELAKNLNTKFYIVESELTEKSEFKKNGVQIHKNLDQIRIRIFK